MVDSFENVRSIDWLNDERAVTVAVQRQPDSNTMAIVDNINKVLPRFAAQLPAGITDEGVLRPQPDHPGRGRMTCSSPC